MISKKKLFDQPTKVKNFVTRASIQSGSLELKQKIEFTVPKCDIFLGLH